MYGADYLPVAPGAKPERIPRRHMLYGRITRVDEEYGRDVRVSPHMVAGVLGATAITRAISRLIATLVRAPSAAPARGWKDLRNGPQFPVTQIWLTDADGVVAPVEIHGHLSSGALARRDQVRVAVRRQRDPYRPPRAVAIENLTTGRMLRPRGATLWSHFGPALILQSLLGLVLLGLLVAALLRTRH